MNLGFLKQAAAALNEQINERNQDQGGRPQASSAQSNPQQQNDRNDKGFGLPENILQAVDKYVDTFEPGISAGVLTEIKEFEERTIQALEDHVKSTIKGIFAGDSSQFQNNKTMDEFRANREQPQTGANLPQYNYPATNVVASREGGQGNLPEYGSRGLPFAGGGAGPAPSQGAQPQQERNIFETALGKVKTFAKNAADDVGDAVGDSVQGIAKRIDHITDHIDDKLEEIAPEIKEKVSKVLQDLHLGLAEKMTKAALTQVKKFLRGNISLEDLGGSALEGLGGLLKGFLDRDGPQTRAIDGNQPSGPTALLSNKLSSGLTRIRRSSRDDFRAMLSKIEEALFNSLPDGLKGPLSKIFGGNPFEARAAQQAQQGGSSDGFFDEIGDKIREIVERIQHALRDRVLEVVSGGHRRLEDKAWGNVQDAIVNKVRQYVPGVQVQLKDE
ncbi:hypothetical protein FRB99_007116 [Tulasnella sp. 403]|nr:hypothetical protein FRB99_007116 [Tulasnella sp. 403]